MPKTEALVFGQRLSCFVVPWWKVQEEGERQGGKISLVQIRSSNMGCSWILVEDLTL